MKTKILKKMQSLKAKIVLLTAGLIIISNVVLAVIAYHISRPALENAITQTISGLNDNVSSKIIAQNERIFHVLESMAELSSIKDEDFSLQEKTKILQDVKRVDTEFVNIAFYDKNGLSITDDGRTIDFSSASYFVEAITGKKYIRDPVISDVNNALLMFYAVPVRGASGGIIGVICAIVDGKSLSNFCAETTIGKSSHPIIINQKTGRTIGDSDPSYVEKGQVLIDVLGEGGMRAGIEAGMRGESGITSFFEPMRKKTMLAAYFPVGGGTDWFVFCMVPRDEYMSSIDKMLFVMIIEHKAAAPRPREHQRHRDGQRRPHEAHRRIVAR